MGFDKPDLLVTFLNYAVQAWSSALEFYGDSRVISIDTSKGFDHVWHKDKGLLAKLPMFDKHLQNLHQVLN